MNKSPEVRASQHSERSSAGAVAVSCALVWGLTTFGAVYAWAYIPLFLFCGVWGALAAWRWSRGFRWSTELIFACLLAVVVALQLVPMQVREISGLASVLRAIDVGYAIDSSAWHPISVAPGLTAIALAALVSLGLWTCGAAQLLSVRMAPVAVARIVAVIGAAIALEAIAQKSVYNGKMYWFWESQFKAAHNYFGPFVNRNHFAGWMLLALAITAAYLCAQVASVKADKRLQWREKVLWLSSPESARLALTAAACITMGVALVWSMSRSGIAGGTVACLILAATAAWRMRSLRAVAASTAIVLTLGIAAMWKGTNELAAWYGTTTTLEWRFRLWNDTMPALKDFWLSGAGLNTYGRVMLVYPQTDQMVHAQQAHNDYLQLAVEGGLLVCVPVLMVAAAISYRIMRRLNQPQDEMTWWIRMGATAGLCGMAVQELTEFSLQIPGVALLFATCIAIAVHDPAPLTARRHSRRQHPDQLHLVTSI